MVLTLKSVISYSEKSKLNMQYKQSWIIIIILLLVSTIVISQHNKKLEPFVSDTTLLGKYRGKIVMHQQIGENNKIYRQGKLNFKSSLEPFKIGQFLGYSELVINGQYLNDKKDGRWDFIINSYEMVDPRIDKNAQLIRSRLSSNSQIYKLYFKEGRRNNNWEITTVNKGKTFINDEYPKASIHFKNDTLFRSFSFHFKDEKFGLSTVNGNLNEDGFFDGTMTISYFINDSTSILEERIYHHGLLLQVNKKSNDYNELIQYDDVIESLNIVGIEKDGAILFIDSTRYPINFDFNYVKEDPKRLIQNDGNTLVESAFNLFDDIHVFARDRLNKIIGLNTKRFVYNYPYDNLEVINSNIQLSDRIQKSILSIINRPKFNLRKTQSIELTKIYAILNAHFKHLNTIDDFLIAMKDSTYIYKDRRLYIDNAQEHFLIPEFIIDYEYGNKDFYDTIRLDYVPQQFESLSNRVHNYLKLIDQNVRNIESSIDQSLIAYDEQDVIDSLEMQLADRQSLIDLRYKELNALKGKNLNEMPFKLKVYTSVHERFITPLRNKYFNNGLNTQDALSTGKELLCYLDYLSLHADQFEKIPQMPKIWEDSIFIIYTDNPFDYRKFESRIMPGIQSASNILLKYYADNILNAKNCEVLEQNIENIYRLNERLGELRENFNEDNVKLIERSLRRERVPQRIIRLLEL